MVIELMENCIDAGFDEKASIDLIWNSFSNYRTSTDKCVFTNIVSTNDGGIGTNSGTFANMSFGV